jgi:hypothetical protein
MLDKNKTAQKAVLLLKKNRRRLCPTHISMFPYMKPVAENESFLFDSRADFFKYRIEFFRTLSFG